MNSKQKKLLEKWQKWSLTDSIAHQFELEIDALESSVKRLSGLYMVQTSPFKGFVQLSVKDIQSKVAFGLPEQDWVNLHCEPNYLPLRENSVDVIGLHHSLDFFDDPHQQLREACRAVVPNGYVIVHGFNPKSLWGLYRLLTKNVKNTLADARFISSGRVADWLTLLDFHVESIHYQGYHWPFGGPKLRSLMGPVASLFGRSNMPFAAGYMLVARKLVAGSTHIRPQWKRRFAPGIELPSPQAREKQTEPR